MAGTYTTIQGDTWDLISFLKYGEEKYMKYLIEANRHLVDVLVFSAGTKVIIPDLPEDADENAPIWRQEANGSDNAYYSPVTEVNDE